MKNTTPTATKLMKAISKVPRNSPDTDLDYSRKMIVLRSQMLQIVVLSEPARKAFNNYGQSVVSNEINKSDFVANILSAKDDEEEGSIAFLENVLKCVESVTPETFDEKFEFLSKLRFTLKLFESIAAEIRTVSPETSAQLKTHIASYIKVRNDLITPHMRLVHQLAKSSEKKSYAHDLEDLTMQGFEGLVKAAERFDPERGVQFGTYASNWIRQVISRYVIDTGHIVRHPVHLAEDIQELQNKVSKVEAKLGPEPTAEEIAQHTEIPVEKIKKVQAAVYHTVSLNATIQNLHDNSAQTYLDALPDTNSTDPEDEAHQSQLRTFINELLADTLDPRSEKIIRLRFGLSPEGEELTSEAVGSLIGRTRERARQIEQAALDMLRARKRMTTFNDFVE